MKKKDALPETADRPLKMAEVARICGVSARTVANWIDQGLLKAWRLPGSHHRRVPLENLADFMKKKRHSWHL